MIFIHARSLTADDMASIGNNVLPAVRRDRRRPALYPAAASSSTTDHSGDHVRPVILRFISRGANPAA